MIQINLLPSIKAEYVKAQRTKRTVITISIIAVAVSLGVVGLLASVAYGTQQLQLNNLKNDIAKSEQNIKDVKDLDKILTIQNQLLHSPHCMNLSQLWNDYLRTCSKQLQTLWY